MMKQKSLRNCFCLSYRNNFSLDLIRDGHESEVICYAIVIEQNVMQNALCMCYTVISDTQSPNNNFKVFEALI